VSMVRVSASLAYANSDGLPCLRLTGQ
jgi:hypothetical protein